MKAMEYVYSNAKLSKHSVFGKNVNPAAKRLDKTLSQLDIHSLEITDYSKRYFCDYLSSLTAVIQRYSYVLLLSLEGGKNLKEIVFLDYGGGLGIMSMLAKEAGVGTVVYTDIYPKSCKDAKTIAENAGQPADHYVVGDVDDVLRFLKKESLSCDAVASNDVIEHIYDPDCFFTRLPEFSDGSLTISMASGANRLHPLIKRDLTKKQIEAEYQDRERNWGNKETDCYVSYFRCRKDMITEHVQNIGKKMSDEEIEKLARKTRGMMRPDILKAADMYFKTRVLPHDPEHPTNTCDPYTGNWAEHLMNPKDLADVLSSRGFKTKVLPGYYGYSENSIKRIIFSLLDYNIGLLGSGALRIAPFYLIYGRR
jgi:2-polyprenyl-3-methyl-5-hydroxy-6-metoxy-1,4-benzoquinol methylase